ncbi:methylated-DNA--[protein]-cysteine S-methyltransferase [Mesobacterium pallidum]|uniref:methylated-DNA--[protein]-cysteine S-methyltransferase n=1 Tax=Mesobacterium pallidum TaxID=2872037 RepID=UPI001EE37F7D|nr:methylated-DNA--[protein]-cysteine S-methyltransferase [Mesobacterium pallidum]
MPRMTLDTPTGTFSLTEEDGAITRATWAPVDDGARDDTPLLTRAAEQIRAYFEDGPLSFDLPLRVAGSAFQQAVCAEMAAIPLGETSTYGQIAKRLKAPAQAVGQACGANPIALIIPCHRVLGTGNLGGFSGGSGVETKVWLLRHERAGGLLI